MGEFMGEFMQLNHGCRQKWVSGQQGVLLDRRHWANAKIALNGGGEGGRVPW